MHNLLDNKNEISQEEYTEKNILEMDLEMILNELDEVSMALEMPDKPC
ncbi:MAG: hypothetical protein Q4B23_05305 [Helcococcus sp.]|nr:hypothetical protein [Helcococcus sp.]